MKARHRRPCPLSADGLLSGLGISLVILGQRPAAVVDWVAFIVAA
jgi:hypothetical protein